MNRRLNTAEKYMTGGVKQRRNFTRRVDATAKPERFLKELDCLVIRFNSGPSPEKHPSQHSAEVRKNRRRNREAHALAHAFVTAEHRQEFLSSAGRIWRGATEIGELANRAIGSRSESCSESTS